MTYAEWITAYERRHEGKLLGRCREAATEMAAAFPELRIARGHATVLSWGIRGHWWLVAPNGAIVDPTKSQFPLVLDYEEWTPGDEVRVGKCMECGEEIWAALESLDEPPPHKTFCDENCERSFTSAVMGEG